METSSVKKRVRASTVNRAIIIVLCVALSVSLYYNFRNPYVPDNKRENLGKLTYKLPEDTEWTKIDGDAVVALEGETDKVLGKGYVGENRITLTVYYDYGEDIPRVDFGEWNNEYGSVPKAVRDVKVFTDENDEMAGTYWEAHFTADETEYIVRVSQADLVNEELCAIGQSLIQSVEIDKSLKDEFAR